jgi:hypothetical protein
MGIGYYAIVFGATMAIGVFAAIGTLADGRDLADGTIISLMLAVLTTGITALCDAAGAL